MKRGWKGVENDEIPSSRQVSSLEYLVVMDFGARREISQEMRSDCFPLFRK